MGPPFAASVRQASGRRLGTALEKSDLFVNVPAVAAGDELGGRAPGPAANRRLAARLLLASVLAYGATAACYGLMIRTSLGQRFDQAAYLGIPGQSPTVTRVTDTLLQQITAYSLVLALLVLVAIGVLRRRPLLGMASAFAAGIAVELTDLSKNHVFSRPPPASSAFPSGHTATAVACAMALVFVSKPAWRGIAAVVAGSYGWITAAQVELAGWHRPSDAIGGAFLAFGSVAAVAGVLAWVRPVDRDSRGVPGWAIGMLAGVAIAAAVGTAWGLVRVLGDLRHHTTSTGSAAIHHAAYLTGLAMTIEVVVILLLVLIALFDRWDFDGRTRPDVSRS
jgi:membrane-associated phospholipid phosphatase